MNHTSTLALGGATVKTVAYLCHVLAGGVVYATNCYWCGVPLELISRGLLWIGR
jgi:hypothetical protein